MRGTRRFASVVLTLALAGLAAPSAAASDDCFPPCRDGYVCDAGACVEAPAEPPAEDDSCFPPCREGFWCQAGACVAAPAPAPEPEPEPEPVDPAPAPAPAPPPQEPAAEEPPAPAPGGLAPPPVVGPGAPAPLPLDPAAAHRVEEAEASFDDVRERFQLGLRLAAGWATAYPRPRTLALDGMRTADDGPAVGLGLGIRKHFTAGVGIQAGLRAHAWFFGADAGSPDSSGVVPIGGWDHGYGIDGVGLRVLADVTLRLVPGGRSFPLFLGVGAAAGADIVLGEVTFTEPNPSHTPALAYTEVNFRAGPVIELGVLFGADEQFELGARVEITATDDPDFDRDGFDGVTALLDFAWCWL